MVAQLRNNFLTLRKILRFSWQTEKLCILTSFYSFFIFHTYLVIFCDIFALFLAQNFKLKFGPRKEILPTPFSYKYIWYKNIPSFFFIEN